MVIDRLGGAYMSRPSGANAGRRIRCRRRRAAPPDPPGIQHGIPGERLAEAAGLSMSRVYQIRDGRRWRVVIGHEGKSIYIGTFDSVGEAGAAVRKARARISA
jgi:hypothetical protein